MKCLRSVSTSRLLELAISARLATGPLSHGLVPSTMEILSPHPLMKPMESQKHSRLVAQKPLNAGITHFQSSKKVPRLQLNAHQTKSGEASRPLLQSETTKFQRTQTSHLKLKLFIAISLHTKPQLIINQWPLLYSQTDASSSIQINPLKLTTFWLLKTRAMEAGETVWLNNTLRMTQNNSGSTTRIKNPSTMQPTQISGFWTTMDNSEHTAGGKKAFNHGDLMARSKNSSRWTLKIAMMTLNSHWPSKTTRTSSSPHTIQRATPKNGTSNTAGRTSERSGK